MSRSTTHRLQRLQRKYFLLRLLEVLCLGAASGILIFTLFEAAGTQRQDSLLLGILVGTTVFLWQFYRAGLHQLSLQRMASFLNKRYDGLQWSSELLLTSPGELSGLQVLQREKIVAQIGNLPAVSFPHHLFRGTAVLAASVLLLVSLPLLKSTTDSTRTFNSPSDVSFPDEHQTVPPAVTLNGFSVSVNAPAYTGLGVSSSKDPPNLKVAEGSMVTWKIEFSGKPRQSYMVFSGRDTSQLEGSNSLLSSRNQVRQSGFYQVVWSDGNDTRTSDFFRLEVIPDAEPNIFVKDLPQFQEFEGTEAIRVPVTAEIADDYGLTDAFIVATVSKGSGESVKFREEKLAFTLPTAISGKKINAQRVIDLRKLGLEPGDELYFYVQAWDNRKPSSQSARTETYFIKLKDTASYITSADGGLGVDLMPEFFRSQRQIIIDSEKLVSERGKVKKPEFDSRSNNLAHDQKVLRLRYGQFLGEEFESGMNRTEVADEGDHDHEEEEVDVLKEYGHAHDTDNEHNLVPQETHDHESPGSPDEKEDPLEAFAHMHDNEEEATFFVQSVKAKLRAALSLMWDAELHLRMNSPEQSLPYQYKILTLLKEISNDSRIYVHRTGFDPPPIKEDKRLTGDLSEINPARKQSEREQVPAFPNTRAVMPILERLIQDQNRQLSSAEGELLSKAGAELAGVALEQPGQHLESMSLLKALVDGELAVAGRKQAILQIRKSLWQILPEEPAAPAGVARSVHATGQQLLDQLEKPVNE